MADKRTSTASSKRPSSGPFSSQRNSTDYYHRGRNNHAHYGFSLKKSNRRKGIGGRRRKEIDIAEEVMNINSPMHIAENEGVEDQSVPDLNISNPDYMDISDDIGTLAPVDFSTPRTANPHHSLYTVSQKCLTCNGKGTINIQTLNSAVRNKTENIRSFEDENGKIIYTHVRFPDRHPSLSSTGDRTLRYLYLLVDIIDSSRRSDILLHLIEALVNEDDNTILNDSMSRLIVSLLNRRKDLKIKVLQGLKVEYRKLSTKEALPLLTEICHSKNAAEKIMAKLNTACGTEIFENREDYRKAFKEHDLNAQYEQRIVKIEREDIFEIIPVAYMKNINEVLSRYVKIMEGKFTFSEKSGGNVYLMRLGLDKGGDDCKISLSFANMSGCQSPFSQIIIGAYTGPDTNNYLSKTVPEIFKETSKIKRLPYGDGEIPVKLFIVGDNKALSAVFGHSGQSSYHPCIICPVDHNSIKINGGVTGPFVKPRSDYISEESANASMNGVKLLDIDFHNVVPPCLHNVLSPTHALHSSIYKDAAYIDRTNISKTILREEDLPSSWCGPEKKSLSQILTKQGVVNCEKIAQKMIAALKINQNKPGDSQDVNSSISQDTSCTLPWCYKRLGLKLAVKYGGSTQICCICRKEFHTFCNGQLEPGIKSKKQQTCKSCTSPGIDPITIFENSLSFIKSEVQLDELLKECRKTKGCVFHIDEFLKEIKVTPQNYFGGILTGNHCERFLEHVREIAAILWKAKQDKKEIAILKGVAARYAAYGNCLKNIQHLTKNDILSEDEQKLLQEICGTIPKIVKSIPALNLTPKLHGIAAHFSKFAQEHGSLGIFSEQYIESGHVEWNRLTAHYSTTKTGPQKLEAVMRNNNTRNVIQMLNRH